MNKSEIKSFAIWARKKLISNTLNKMEELGITKMGIQSVLGYCPNLNSRNALVGIIKEKEAKSDLATAIMSVAEEVAYTWFNRLIAVRFMEVNGYLPSGVRVLSSKKKSVVSDLLSKPYSADISFSKSDKQTIAILTKTENQDQLFKLLFIKQCEKLSDILPLFFYKTEDYFNLLFNVNITDKNDVIFRLVNTLNEEDFNVEKQGQVEIIGWLYQYYNSEPKDIVYGMLQKNIKISKENIPAATQLFTPDWIVRYMAENSLLPFMRRALNIKLRLFKPNVKYFVKSPNHILRKSRANTPFNITSIRVLDPCMGSGHILVYIFDLLLQAYRLQGVDEKQAVVHILENNLYGFDIDKRAYQLAYFAVMMKARKYNPDIFKTKVNLNLYTVKSCKELDDTLINFIAQKSKPIKHMLKSIKLDLKNADEFGSLINVTDVDFNMLYQRIAEIESTQYTDLIDSCNKEIVKSKVLPFINLARALSMKYHVVVTNPPYLSDSGMSKKLNTFVKSYYGDSKSDLFATFIERCIGFTEKNGYTAMITQQSFMYLSSFEKLRKKLINTDMVSLLHLGARAFDDISGEVVKTCAFVLRNSHTPSFKSVFIRLTDQKSEAEKQCAFLQRNKENTFIVKCSNFLTVPSKVYAYMCTEQLAKCFAMPRLDAVTQPRQGLACGDVARFRRNWYEVDYNTINFSADSVADFHQSKGMFAPINDGGSYRKWYGNNIAVLKFNKENYLQLLEIGNHLPSKEMYFKKGITWTAITSCDLSLRYFDKGYLFSNAGMAVFDSEENLLALCALLNSKVANVLMSAINESLNYNRGDIARIPVSPQLMESEELIRLTRECIKISKEDWDSSELSFDFKKHPLI